ncbi:MAG TPA: pepsin-like aspartic protease [Kofleriaceae bacterium]|jgi:hypothetical protein
MARTPLHLAIVAALVACSSHDATQLDAGPIDAPMVPTGTVAIPLTSLDELSYTGVLRTGGQAQSVIVDTGSTTLAVASSACTNCGVTPLYTPGSGAVDEHQIGTEMFTSDTGWTGEIYQDSVVLGSDAVVPVQLVAIGSASNFFEPFDDAGDIGFEGILGLGPDSNLIPDTTSYLTAAFAAGVPRTFAFQLCPSDGTMWIGGVDTAAEASAPAVTPMLSSTTEQLDAYLVTIAAMAIGSGSNVGSDADYGPAIIDTGSSISFIPTAPLAAITAAIQASAGYQSIFGTQSLTDTQSMGCVTTAQTGSAIDAALPPLHIAFPDATGTTSTDLALPATKSYLVFSGSTGSGADNEWCYALVDSSQLGPGPAVSLIGDSLLNAVVVSFDVANQQVSFAPTLGCGESDAVLRPVHRGPKVAGVAWWRQRGLHSPRARRP